VVHKWNERGSKDEDEIDAKVKFFSLMTIYHPGSSFQLKKKAFVKLNFCEIIILTFL